MQTLTMSLADAADRIPVHPRYLQRKAAEGVWPGHKIANRWRFTESDIQQILDLTRRSPRPVEVPANGRSPRARTN